MKEDNQIQIIIKHDADLKNIDPDSLNQAVKKFVRDLTHELNKLSNKNHDIYDVRFYKNNEEISISELPDGCLTDFSKMCYEEIYQREILKKSNNLFDDYEKPYDYSLFDEPDDNFFDE